MTDNLLALYKAVCVTSFILSIFNLISIVYINDKFEQIEKKLKENKE